MSATLACISARGRFHDSMTANIVVYSVVYTHCFRLQTSDFREVLVCFALFTEKQSICWLMVTLKLEKYDIGLSFLQVLGLDNVTWWN